MTVTLEANGLYRCVIAGRVYWGPSATEAVLVALKLERPKSG